MVKDTYKLDFTKKRYGVTRWQYQKLDCIDLYMELLILLNYKVIDKCRPCCHFLKWVLKILQRKWDNIRYIELEEALKLARHLKTFVPKCVVLEHFTIHRKLLKQMITEIKKSKTKTIEDIIFENKFFFVEGVGKYIHPRELIYNCISSNNDLYRVNDFKNDLAFI